jgi:hypothetical protein
MKQTLLVLGVASILSMIPATPAFGQYYGGALSAQPQPYHAPDHPQTATYAPMQVEHSLYGGSGSLYVTGDRPASDFPQVAPQSLGEAARELKKEHERVKKAHVVWIN